MSEQVVDSFNLFVDSSRSSQAGSTGTDLKISLVNDIVEAGKGQMIRISLTDFAMEKPFTDINQLNNFGKIQVNGTHRILDFALDNINLSNLQELATAFGDAIKAAYNAFRPNTLRVDDASVGKDNRISISVNFGLPTNVPPNFNIQLNSDLHLLLGGDYSDTTFDSLTVTPQSSDPTTNTVFVIQSKYPAALRSQHYLYLRTNLSNTGIETAGFGSHNFDPQTDTDHSTILGRIPLQTGVIYYEAQTGREYFLNLRQKNVSHIRLYLTDEHNRSLPLFAGQNAHKGTARFTCTLRIDIIQVRMPNEFETPPYNPGIPPRFTSNFLEKLDFGAPYKNF